MNKEDCSKVIQNKFWCITFKINCINFEFYVFIVLIISTLSFKLNLKNSKFYVSSVLDLKSICLIKNLVKLKNN